MRWVIFTPKMKEMKYHENYLNSVLERKYESRLRIRLAVYSSKIKQIPPNNFSKEAVYTIFMSFDKTSLKKFVVRYRVHVRSSYPIVTISEEES